MTPTRMFMTLPDGRNAPSLSRVDAASSVDAASPAALEHQADVADNHLLVDRLPHVVHGERGHRHGGQRFHLDAGPRSRAYAGFDRVAARAWRELDVHAGQR